MFSCQVLGKRYGVKLTLNCTFANVHPFGDALNYLLSLTFTTKGKSHLLFHLMAYSSAFYATLWTTCSQTPRLDWTSHSHISKGFPL